MKFRIHFLALAATTSLLARGAWVDEAAATHAAASFLGTSTGQAILPDRAVSTVAPRGNLWIAALAPSGHVIVSGSDRATPILGFSAEDFSEPEVDSPARAALDATDDAVAAAEADETKEQHQRWVGLLAAKNAKAAKVRLLASNAQIKTASAVNIEPFVTSRYNQCQPWNDMTPVVENSNGGGPYRARSLAGCVSIADAALIRALRWPVYVSRSDVVTHEFRGGTFKIRFDGSMPFDWDLLQDTYPTSGDLRGTLAEDRRYQIARYIMWLNHSARMSYQVGEALSTKYNAAHGCERDWYTIGRSMEPTAEGVQEIVTRTLAAGIPVFVGVGGHAVVADGWKTENDEAFVDLVYGWGGAGSWYSVETGPVKYFWVEHYPRAKPQLDPIPRVSSNEVALAWHFPDCHTNKLEGFTVTALRRTSAAWATWQADFSDAATGHGFPEATWSTVDDGASLCGEDDKRGYYQFAVPLSVTADSELSLEVRGGVNKDNIIIEICGDDGNWERLFVPVFNWQYWPGSWRQNTCSLAAYAGQAIQLRIFKTDVLYNGKVAIRNFRVTNAAPVSGETTTMNVAATARSATLSGLKAGADYAISVKPVLAADALTTAEPSNAKVTTVEGTHTVLGSEVETVSDYETEETSIVFDDLFQLTADSHISCAWYADCSKGGVMQLKIIFTPDVGVATNFYNSSFKMKTGNFDFTGNYVEDVDVLPSIVGVPGTLSAIISLAYDGEEYPQYGDIGTTSINSLSVSNVRSLGGETEELTARGLPEFTSIQYAANGSSAKDLTDGYLADGSIGRSFLFVECSAAVTNLTASPSHVSLVSNELVHVSRLAGEGSRWKIEFDPAIPANRNRQRMILTLNATDLNGTIVHKDVVMRMTTDSGVDGGSTGGDDDDVGLLYEPQARPIAVWNGDFADGAQRGAVTLNLQGNAVTNDGAAVVKTAGKGGIDFAIANGGTAVMAVAGVEKLANTSDMATLVTVSTSGTEEDSGLGVASADYKYRALINSTSGQWYTKSVIYSAADNLHALAFSSTTSGISVWRDGTSAFTSSDAKVNLDGTAVTDLVLGGWKNSTAFGATDTLFNYVAIFTNQTASANDVSNWALTNMTGAVSILASGGALTALETGRDLGLNLNGGTVTLDESIHAAALFVQDDTTLNVSMGCGISGSRILYVAPGKTLTVNVVCDATALSNAVSAAGGVYTTRILQGANYGDIAFGALPVLGERYEVKMEQKNVQGVFFTVTDTKALDIVNTDSAPVGYIDGSGVACVITNATGTIVIPEQITMVQVVAKDDAFGLSVSADTPPQNIVIYASNAAGAVEPGSSFAGIVLTAAFQKTVEDGGASISYELNPDAELNGVKVRPEFDMGSTTNVLSFAGTGNDRIAYFPIKVIPGLWYSVEYADNVRFSDSSATPPETKVNDASTVLTAPATGARVFYRIRVGASKAALSD